MEGPKRWYIHHHEESTGVTPDWIFHLDDDPKNQYDSYGGLPAIRIRLEKWLHSGTSDLILKLPNMVKPVTVVFPARIGHVLDSELYGQLNLKLYAVVKRKPTDLHTIGTLVRNYGRDWRDYDSAPRLKVTTIHEFDTARRQDIYKYYEVGVPLRKRMMGHFTLEESTAITQWIHSRTHRHDVILLPNNNLEPTRYTVLHYPQQYGEDPFPINATDYMLNPEQGGPPMPLLYYIVMYSHTVETIPYTNRVRVVDKTEPHRAGKAPMRVPRAQMRPYGYKRRHVTTTTEDESEEPMDLSECRVCGQATPFACSGCKRVLYCNNDLCQPTDWILHRQVCHGGP